MKDRMYQLKKELDEAFLINEDEIASKIKSIGFECSHCARCCKKCYGDNTVTVFPYEIRSICRKTGLLPEDIVIPTPSPDRDSEGNVHTFEWVLIDKGDCMFLKKGLCKIYECRPHICKTYPFYLQYGRLMISECEGLGGKIAHDESRRMAASLKERYISEIKEAILVFDRFRGFKPGGIGNLCVHDSEGEHWIHHPVFERRKSS